MTVVAKLVSILLLLLCLVRRGETDGILPEDEVYALRAVISSLGLAPAPSISSSYCAWNPGRAYSIYIICDCNYDNGTICHITRITTASIDLSGGGIHESISQLKYLEFLDLGNNQLSGSIPDTIGDLQALQTLNLYKNLLTGPIPPSLGKLSSLKELRLYRNLLSDEIPKQLGSLSKLETLRLEQNQLSGHIPLELGNLLSLKQLTLDENRLNGTLPGELGNLGYLLEFDVSSNNLTGELNQSFARLRSLNFFSVAGNNLTGQIPNYIAKWSGLVSLNLIGNEFEGKLPEEIFNMENLEVLKVSDLRNTGFSIPKEAKLPKIYNMVLRNCSINGSIPDDIGKWPSLRYLDLSFNNLTGEIPGKFKDLKLSTLFLNRNMLNGTLPRWISDAVDTRLDLTYNNFSKPLTEQKNPVQQLNISLSRDDILAMRDEHCGDKSKYNSLFINCGGPKLKEEGHEYDEDNSTSTFGKDRDGKWVYTCSGHFLSTTSNSSDYLKNMTCGVSENSLYRTGRLCPVALSYYAFCLHDDQYNVTLHFAETVYTKEEDYSSLGKRIFDVYIQGKCRQKDFEIKGWSGGPNQEMTLEFPYTNVQDNLLQIHLYWAGKGSLNNPPALNGPLLSAISVIPSKPPGKKLTPGQKAVIIMVSVFTPLLLLAFVWKMGWLPSREWDEKKIRVQTKDGKERYVSLREIIKGTGNFDLQKKIGEGRFGEVYRGDLEVEGENISLAVKRISQNLSKKGKKKSSESQQEVENDTRRQIFCLSLSHENLVPLLHHHCEQGLHLLIYEFMENGSLDQALFSNDSDTDPKPVKKIKLDWKARLGICLGIAKGLEYMHQKKHMEIIHGNVNATNIMLDGDLNAKLSDFGLACLYPDDPIFHYRQKNSEQLQHLAPEWTDLNMKKTTKADVYSFGVLMLEIICGRKVAEYDPSSKSTKSLLDDVSSAKEMILRLVDKKLTMSSNKERRQAQESFELARDCIKVSANDRPTMSHIVERLHEFTDEGDRSASQVDTHSIEPQAESLKEFTDQGDQSASQVDTQSIQPQT
ncbi:probable LRR receptor-like serine/threonine-protein kinase At1g53420 isoform X2 [Manihot esculenta]|uniref:non-specific serine/threonine protein kinase n=1 Tax=Manihot esculenta TaxID=3983 RepID=A0A2C9UGT7_MANES|nr:probable LRR receptor-like serine/threonine-protein kinase At1g53420 isoform X2 [Manihot esculenta]OAY28984.1 hypothetical protein MANES_15G108900v8 [Manihot esculenta]